MLRLASAMLVRIGLVFLVMSALVRFIPMPNRADVIADDFSIAISLVLVLGASIYLRLTRDTTPTSPHTKPTKVVQRISR